jgi:hypothetical protein
MIICLRILQMQCKCGRRLNLLHIWFTHLQAPPDPEPISNGPFETAPPYPRTVSFEPGQDKCANPPCTAKVRMMLTPGVGIGWGPGVYKHTMKLCSPLAEFEETQGCCTNDFHPTNCTNPCPPQWTVACPGRPPITLAAGLAPLTVGQGAALDPTNPLITAPMT